MIWVAVAAVAGAAYGFGVGITGLVVTVAVVSALLATVVYLAPTKTRQPVTEP
jgi:uncharacterized membrane protein